jgi:hypothetical protein
MNKITQKELQRILHYDPDTGIFIWKARTANRTHIGTIAGTKSVRGYVCIQINKKIYAAHRLAFLYMEGYLPENDVDHINRIKDDNRWCNLREVSKSCNKRNQKVSKNNTTGVSGVYWKSDNKMWCCTIGAGGSKIFLGYFKNKLDAAKARLEAEVKYGYPNCCSTSSSYQYIQKHEKTIDK